MPEPPSSLIEITLYAVGAVLIPSKITRRLPLFPQDNSLLPKFQWINSQLCVGG